MSDNTSIGMPSSNGCQWTCSNDSLDRSWCDTSFRFPIETSLFSSVNQEQASHSIHFHRPEDFPIGKIQPECRVVGNCNSYWLQFLIPHFYNTLYLPPFSIQIQVSSCSWELQSQQITQE